jgi:hypothetical protein
MTAELDPAVGRQLLDDLGFLLVPGPPEARGTAYLFAALRPHPTLRHFDPERVDYWTTGEGHGVAASLDWSTRVAASSAFSWGEIRIIDRLDVSNEFVAFGGQLKVATITGVKVAVFSSVAPIVARGGHSQEWEPGSRDLAAFVARLRAAADPRQDLERRLAALSPAAIYAAYVATERAHAAASARSLGWAPEARNLLRREEARLRAESPDDWTAGSRLATELAERGVVEALPSGSILRR